MPTSTIGGRTTTTPSTTTPTTTTIGPVAPLGVPIGPSRLPTELYLDPFTSTKLSLSPDSAIAELEEARSAGMRVFIVLVGSQRHYRALDGTFDLELWKLRVDRFRSIDLDEYALDGTILAHQLVSEGKVRSEWGGEVIPNDVLDEMARYSKEFWPAMPTILRTDVSDLELHAAGYETSWPGWKWKFLDAASSRYLTRKGSVETFSVAEQESADRQGLALAVEMNVFWGGDGSSQIPSPEGDRWAMSDFEIVTYGAALLDLTRACGFGMWRYETDGSDYEAYRYFRRPEIGLAMEHLVALADKRPAHPCH